MISINNIISEMRETADDLCGNTADLLRWAGTLEAAMREPVAYMMANADFPHLTPSLNFTIQSNWHPSWKPIPLYALPPDAAAEIERLKGELDVADRQMEAAHRVMDRNDAKIERLWESLDWYAEQAKTMQKATLHVDNKVALHVMKTLALDGGKRAADVAGEK